MSVISRLPAWTPPAHSEGRKVRCDRDMRPFFDGERIGFDLGFPVIPMAPSAARAATRSQVVKRRARATYV